MLFLSRLVGRWGFSTDRRRRRPLPAGHRPVVATDRRRIFLPWSHVARFDATGARLAHRDHRHHALPAAARTRSGCGPTCSTSRSSTSTDGKVVRVNDLRLDDVDGDLHLVAVDVGAAGLLRRLGLEGGYRIARRNLRLPTPERYIDWEDVDPVETSIASIRLRVPHGGLTELHPADLATIIDQLAPARPGGRPGRPRRRGGRRRDRGDGARHPGRGARGPAPERAADILEEMSPDDAADLVADLSDEHPRGAARR